MTETQNTGIPGNYALTRFNAAAAECPTGAANFAAGFIGALSVGFEDHGKLDKSAWDRAIKISLENATRQHGERRVNP